VLGNPAELAGWRRPLGIHVAVALLFVVWTAAGLNYGLVEPPTGAPWFLAWIALGIVMLASWASALMPPRFWTRWIARSHEALLAGAGVGLFAWNASLYGRRLWSPLRESTIWLVVLLLRIVGQDAVARADVSGIATPSFAVRMSAGCSGIEGVGLVVAFLAVYLVLYRREFRFPRVLLLLPLGALLVWLLNAARIAALVLLGGKTSKAAIEGFHSVAGWLSFNAVAYGLVIASQRSSFFSEADRAPAAPARNPAAMYLAPLIAILFTALVARVFVRGFDVLYPLRVVSAGVILWSYRDLLVSRVLAKPSGDALLAGVATFVVWIALEPEVVPAEDATIAAGLSGLSAAAAATWLAFRMVGSVVTVPLAEELAFRGYLLRKLVGADFEQVSFRTFTWVSFLGSSILFGALHGRLVAGTLAGMIFAGVVYRRGRLADAVFAHAVANGLVTLRVLATGHWSLWS